ncbi:TPA: transglycosylase SLT domain-containing protein [Klebsiella aerogenes]|nr:transglycosylase SLT domain-containing protein [Klebsiella aerogenes]
MERKTAGIGDVIEAVDAASAAELAELARIRESVDNLTETARTPRSVAAGAKQNPPVKLQTEPALSDDIVTAMKRMNLGQPPKSSNRSPAARPPETNFFTAVRQPDDNQKTPTPAANVKPGLPTQRKETITPAQRLEAATQARSMINHIGADNNRSGPGARDSRGRFIGRSGSKAASDEAKAERLEKARHRDEKDEKDERESFLRKLVKAAGEIDNPAETRAADAVGYAVGGPLWAIGKELGGVAKEVGGTVNNTRKSMAEVFKGDGERSGRKGLFGRRAKNSAEVVQLNTQKRTVQELAEQTEAIKDGDQKILERLDKIAGNTDKKGGGIFSKLFGLLGKGGGSLVKMLGGLMGGRLLGKLFGRGLLKTGGLGIGKLGAIALGGFGLNKITRALFGGGSRAAAGAASEAAGGAIASRGLTRLGMKALGKGVLRAIPIVGTIAGAMYDAVTGWNDTDAQRKAFGLKDGEDPSLQQKAAYTAANIMDMGGLVSGISSALGSVLESMGFTDIGKMLQFTTEDMAKTIDEYWTNLENAISGLGKTIASTFTEYTSKIGETVSGWFGGIKDDLTKKLDEVVKFFSLENLGKLFKDAISEAMEFIKHPVESIKKKAEQVVDSTKGKAKEAWASVKNGAKGAYHWLAGDDKQPGAVEKGVEKAKAVAKTAGKEVSKTTDAILNSKVGEMAKQGAQALQNSIGQTSGAVTNVARSAASNVTGTDKNDIQKAADTYNNGNGNVKEGNPNALGAQNLKAMDPLFRSLEQQYGLPEGALYSIAATESKGDAKAVSRTGARGMFQFTRIARKEVGMSDEDAWDPEKSAVGAAKLLQKYLQQANGDWNEAITAYNAGFGTINKWKRGEGNLSKENREYAIKVNTHRARYLGGETYTPGTGSDSGNIVPSPSQMPANAKIDEATGLAFTPGESPFEKGGIVDKVGEKLGINGLADKFLNAPGMRHQAVQGTLAERAYGKGTATAMGNVTPSAIPQPEPIQMPTSQMRLDGRTISDLGGSGAKPTMQLADNTVSLDSETKRIFKRMTDLLDSIEGHTQEAAKQKGTTIKVSTPQPGVSSSVPLSINDPLMNDYARVD